MIFASKCHDLQLRTSILARFVASGAAGRAAAGKILKRGLKWYLLGPSGPKTTYKAYLVPKDSKMAHLGWGGGGHGRHAALAGKRWRGPVTPPARAQNKLSFGARATLA